MTEGKKISTCLVAAVLALSMAAYFPIYNGEVQATSTTCATNAYDLNGTELNNLANGEKYVLSGDATGDLNLSHNFSTPNVTLDLAGCTLNGRVSVSGGSLTIIDSSVNQTGVVTGGSHTNAARVDGRRGTLIINGGTYEKSVGQNGNGGTVTISGGVFPSSNVNFVRNHLTRGYGHFTLGNSRIVVEKNLTESDVTFPDSIELFVGETKTVEITTALASKVLSYTYTPTENEYFSVNADGVVTGKKVVANDNLTVTVFQGANEVARKDVPVKVKETEVWIKGADEKPTQYIEMEAGKSLVLDAGTNRTDVELMYVFAPAANYADDATDEDQIGAVSVGGANGRTLFADNTGMAIVTVAGYYEGIQVAMNSVFVRVYPTEHKVVMGDGAEFDGSNLTQKITGDKNKFRFATYYDKNDAKLKSFLAKYGEDQSQWNWETTDEYFELLAEIRKEIDPSNYVVSEGSTVVTFLSSWLKTLNPGIYNVQYSFTDGHAEATFVIPEPVEEPKNVVETISVVTVGNTGVMTEVKNEEVKNSMTGPMIAVAMVSGIVAATYLVLRRKKA